MAELAPITIEGLKPGDIIELSEIGQLCLVEDLVAESIDPEMDEESASSWAGRVAITELIKPENFYGKKLADISLQVIGDPYTQLHSAHERGWRFTQKGVVPRVSKGLNGSGSETATKYWGFVFFTADVRSTGRGSIGQIQSEIYLGPINQYSAYHAINYSGNTSQREVRLYTTAGADAHAGSSIVRYVTKSRPAPSFIEANKASRRVGATLLRRQAANPRLEPMR